MTKDFQQIQWDDTLREDCRQLVRLALREDLQGQSDWTTLAMVPAEREGQAHIVARESGVVAGLPSLEVVLEESQAQLTITAHVSEGERVSAGSRLASLSGNVRDLLTCERTMLNLLGRLMGIATLTESYVAKAAGTETKIYDTRKTTPGWRRLEKYAVGCGGGRNHRTGLFDAILIKDNHLAQSGADDLTVADAVGRARAFIAGQPDLSGREMPIEIEVDTLQQLSAVLPAEPDIVLLDNMSTEELSSAVQTRNRLAPQVILEASGGVNLDSLPGIIATGVDRISVGGLTHSARALDVALDWQSR